MCGSHSSGEGALSEGTGVVVAATADLWHRMASFVASNYIVEIKYKRVKGEPASATMPAIYN